MSQKKGFFVIKNSEGVVTLAGIATSLTNDVMSANFTDATEISIHRDAGNVPRAVTKDYHEFRLQLRLTPGVGFAHADQATVKTAIAGIRKFDSIVTSGFEDADLNWTSGDKAVVMDIGKTLAQGELMSVDVTAAKFTDSAASPAVIDFTGAWAGL